MMEKSTPIIKVSSPAEALSKVDDAVSLFKDKGLLVFRGAKFSTDDQLALVKALGDVFSWNVSSEASQATIDTSTYSGGHSDQPDKDYSQTADEYVLDWHIEQVYYKYPILAGVWNMTTFTAQAGTGTTRFVDSADVYNLFSKEDKDFLDKSLVIWDKPAPHGSGPFYTKVVDTHPISGTPMLRVETDQGCYSMPKLVLWDGATPTEDQVSKLDSLLSEIKDILNDNIDIRYSQLWEEGDVLIVDLFRMYHSVMGGFGAGQRKFTGIGIRPKLYDNSMYTVLED